MLLTGIPFDNPDGAAASFTRLKPNLSAALTSALPALLAETPDPDSALVRFERLATESTPEIVRLLERHNSLAHYAILVFGHSQFLGDTLLQNTDLLHSYLRTDSFDRSFSREDFHESFARFRSRSFETDIAQLLTRFKRREYVRILLRDVLKIAPLAETTAEISALADVVIEEALREADNQLRRRSGAPRHMDGSRRLADTPFAILSLGKLGGNELNYSSDVDLIYLFGDGAEPDGAGVTNREYFVRLAQQVTDILSRATKEGAVFRIDMRLRPQGAEGELAISLSQALRYYTEVAHDWEQQALIKVRHSAGDTAVAREFIRRVQPHVYVGKGGENVDPISDVAESSLPDPSLHSGFRQQAPASLTPAKWLNFSAIETALEARERMNSQRDRRMALDHSADTTDVKMDRGGIRDIEFLVQCLQRVYGGAEPWLRSGGTLFSLQKLHDKRHITSREFHQLTGAYEFFRHLEHRLQLRQGLQTHRLPESESELRIVERAMQGRTPADEVERDLPDTVRWQMDAVQEIYDRVIHHQQIRRQKETAQTFELQGTAEVSLAEQSNQQILARLAADAPEIYRLAIQHDLSPHVRKNLYRYLSASFTSSERYAEVLRYASAIPRALALFESSDFLTDILVRHPEEIATLAQLGEINARVGSPYLFDMPFGGSASLGDPVFAYVANAQSSYGERLSLLRQHYRHRIFAAGARDLADLHDIYESLGATTAAAEDAISAAFGIAGQPPALAVMALGRLGTQEFDLLSDADLLFVCDEQADRTPIVKAAEQMMQALAAYTRDGMVFPVDARLRPRGDAGELVVTPAQLKSYYEHEAQPWEALTFTKLRFLVGAREVGERAVAAGNSLFQRFALEDSFLSSLQTMRAKLEATDSSGGSFKTSAGAIYDIDFLTGHLLVKHSLKDKQGTLRDRLWRCATSNLIDKSDAAALDHAAELLRTVEHVVRLVVGRARKWLPATEYARQVTEKLTAQILRRDFPEGLDAELQQSCGEVRKIYDRVLLTASAKH